MTAREPGIITVEDQQRQGLADLLAALPPRCSVTVEQGRGLMAATLELVAYTPAGRWYARVDADGTPSSSSGWPLKPQRTAPPLPTAAAARAGDRATSREAARSVNMTARHRAVLEVFRWLDTTRPDVHALMTDVELIERYAELRRNRERHGMTPLPEQTDQSLRSRRAELVRAGYLQDSGDTLTTASGRRTTLWQITEKGRTTTP